MIKYLKDEGFGEYWVVGDIHGCYSLLIAKLKELGFDFEKDTLISVGDLIDRSFENEKVFNLLNERWFVACKGNHEDFCYKGLFDSTIEYYHKMPNNGGSWFYNLPDDLREHIGRRFNQLPIMIELHLQGKKLGFVHADLPVEDWELLKEMVLQRDVIDGRLVDDHIMWSRSIIENYETLGREPIIAQVDNVFLGHTVLPEITQVGNCTFLDTGGVFKKEGEPYDLSIINLNKFIK